jgi:hypothetical protein
MLSFALLYRPGLARGRRKQPHSRGSALSLKAEILFRRTRSGVKADMGGLLVPPKQPPNVRYAYDRE